MITLTCGAAPDDDISNTGHIQEKINRFSMTCQIVVDFQSPSLAMSDKLSD